MEHSQGGGEKQKIPLGCGEGVRVGKDPHQDEDQGKAELMASAGSERAPELLTCVNKKMTPKTKTTLSKEDFSISNLDSKSTQSKNLKQCVSVKKSLRLYNAKHERVIGADVEAIKDEEPGCDR